MPHVAFDTLPDDARLWIFPAAKPVTGAEAERLLARVDAFLADWKAHGTPLSASRDWREDRFLLVAVDERTAPPSGCSIDAMVRVLKGIEDTGGPTLTDHGDVHYRTAAGEIERIDRLGFARKAKAGEVDPDTRVFDTTLTRVGELRDGRLEVPARDAWHGKAFFRDRPAG